MFRSRFLIHGFLLAGLLGLFGTAAAPAWGGEPATTEAARPAFLTLLSNVRDFKLFASGGNDGNWTVGYNTCWVVKLPTAPAGSYARAFLGVRLGRAKSEPVPGSPPWVRRPIEGEIDVAIAPGAIWPESRRFKLVETADIPAEGDTENTSEDVGEARWFWVEVPLPLVNFTSENFVALFSPSPNLTSASSSPILAAGRSNVPAQAWLNTGVHGQPPLTTPEALQTQIPNFAPAIALKLVPANDHAVAVRSFWVSNESNGIITVGGTVLGQDIEKAWLEVSKDQGITWSKSGRFLWGPPYFFPYKSSTDKESILLRTTAVDILGNKGSSQPLVLKDGRKNTTNY